MKKKKREWEVLQISNINAGSAVSGAGYRHMYMHDDTNQ